MKVIAHEDKCVAAGQCAWIAPGVFDQRDDDGVVILLGQPTSEQDDDVRRAEAACPARAIDIQE